MMESVLCYAVIYIISAADDQVKTILCQYMNINKLPFKGLLLQRSLRHENLPAQPYL